jgi:dTDP-4-amino-4,6-dideoxygalactose transaminase
VLTDRDEWAERLRRFRNHGISTELGARRDWRYDLVELGFNYRLTDIGAALGLAQLGRLERFIARRREIAARYLAALGDDDRLELPATDPGVEHAWHLFVVRLRLERLREDRAAVYAAMKAEGIGVNVHYIPVHHLALYSERYPGVAMPVAEEAYSRMLTLPLFPAMTDSDVDDVVRALRKVLDAYSLG